MAGLEVYVLHSKITISSKGALGWEEGTIRVLSMTGSEIYTASLKQRFNEIEIQQGPGIYILALQIEGESYYHKVLIQ